MPPITRTKTGSLPQPDKSSSTATHPPHQNHKPRRRDGARKNALHISMPEPPYQHPEDATWNEPLQIPRFTIDLSLPPEKRYLELCEAFQDDMRGLRELFDQVMADLLPFLPSAVMRWVCWALLWRVYSEEEDRELKGISRATGIEMYLLVCFNVILDLLMGCSSGGASVRDEDPSSRPGAKMVHFRTLDWGMDSLRRVLVRLDFILEPEGVVVASSITYAGFVGVLTGVRKGLSISLNFRGVHDDANSVKANLRYYGHLAMVLLGLRPSISSLLRGFLIPARQGKNATRKRGGGSVARLPGYSDILRQLSCRDGPLLSTACYLCFSSGHETAVIEKDLTTARLRSSSKFIVVTNADAETGDDDDKSVHRTKVAEVAAEGSASPMTALDELIEDANERKACAEQNYGRLLRFRSRASRSHHGLDGPADSSSCLPRVQDIVSLVQRFPTTNECTHFAVVLDPLAGQVAWSTYWRVPIEYFEFSAHEDTSVCKKGPGDSMAS